MQPNEKTSVINDKHLEDINYYITIICGVNIN